MEAKSTPLLDRHKALGAYIQQFAGYFMPIYYTRVIEEHNWTRSNVSIFDTSHMGVIEIVGSAADIDPALTHNLEELDIGRCRYGFLLNVNGGVIDDAIIYRIDTQKWMLVVNASTIDKDLKHLKENVASGVQVTYLDALKKLDVQGPMAREILRDICGDIVDELKYFRFGYFEFFGENCIVSRTGYTGELGFEIYISSEQIISLWSVLLENPMLKPAGLGARDSLRLEMGYPLYGVDLTEQITPIEACIDNFIDYTKDFCGKESLLQLKDKEKQNLCFFMCKGKRIARHGCSVILDSQVVGSVTGGTMSPSLGKPIGSAYINKELIKIGQEIILKNERGIELEAQIVDKPFYKTSSLLK